MRECLACWACSVFDQDLNRVITGVWPADFACFISSIKWLAVLASSILFKLLDIRASVKDAWSFVYRCISVVCTFWAHTVDIFELSDLAWIHASISRFSEARWVRSIIVLLVVVTVSVLDLQSLLWVNGHRDISVRGWEVTPLFHLNTEFIDVSGTVWWSSNQNKSGKLIVVPLVSDSGREALLIQVDEYLWHSACTCDTFWGDHLLVVSFSSEIKVSVAGWHGGVE